MATEAAIPPTPPAHVVGNAFVEQYYQILHKSPESVHRFYQDSSVISRPEPNGLVTTVTTLLGINEKICSFDYTKYTVEIKTADAQDSHKDGVIVLVTGRLTGPDNICKSFTQAFFLAPQDKGYFVLNDVFRFVDNNVVAPLENNKVTVNEARDSAFAPSTLEPQPAQVVNPSMVDSSTSHIEKAQKMEQRVHNQLPNERELVAKKDEPQLNKNQVSEVTEFSTPVEQGDGPKKSYASILASQAKKGVSGPVMKVVYMPTNAAKVAPKKVENKAGVASEPPVEGHSIYVRNLPLNVMASEVEEEFKKFGPIKPGGVQVRNNKPQGSCFGFVEFQSPSSVSDAIQASPVTIKGWNAVVEMKRTSTRVGGGTGRTSSGRGGYQGDNFRGRENYVNGRGYGRNEYANRGEFSGRGRGPGGRGGQVYQQGRGQEGSNRIVDNK